MKATAIPAPTARPDGDKLLRLSEVATIVNRSPEALRILRARRSSNTPPLWLDGGRLVAWRSELHAWLDARRAADMLALRESA